MLNPRSLDALLEVTEALDTSLGTNVNTKKSHILPIHGWKPGTRATSIPSCTSMTYLGTDLTFFARGRHQAKTRAAHLKVRSALVKALPPSSRPACTADVVAALWLPGATCFSKKSHEVFIPTLASALRGSRRDNQVGQRSRLVEHLVYQPGFHRSCPAAWAIYFFAGQLCKFLKKKPNLIELWQRTWEHRSLHGMGPFAAIEAPLALLDLYMPSPTQLALRNDDRPPLDLTEGGKDKQHSLRVLLRHAAWRREALRRPKDFAGLEQGAQVEQHMHKFTKTQCGPTLACGGQWTRARLFAANLSDSPICIRCGLEPEHLHHRLWTCPANAARLKALLERIEPDQRSLIPDKLPPCLRRCGLQPQSMHLSPVVRGAIQAYLLESTVQATTALATFHHPPAPRRRPRPTPHQEVRGAQRNTEETLPPPAPPEPVQGDHLYEEEHELAGFGSGGFVEQEREGMQLYVQRLRPHRSCNYIPDHNYNDDDSGADSSEVYDELDFDEAEFTAHLCC